MIKELYSSQKYLPFTHFLRLPVIWEETFEKNQLKNGLMVMNEKILFPFMRVWKKEEKKKSKIQRTNLLLHCYFELGMIHVYLFLIVERKVPAVNSRKLKLFLPGMNFKESTTYLPHVEGCIEGTLGGREIICKWFGTS